MGEGKGVIERGGEGRGGEGTSIIILFLREVNLAAGGHVDLKSILSTKVAKC
jgi:hypothetical protein